MSEDDKIVEAKKQFLEGFAKQIEASKENLQDEQQELVKKMARHLVGTTDPTLLLLKAHLLIEEKMNYVVRGLLPRADALDGGRFSFDQKNRLLRAFDHLGYYAGLFNFIQRLNRMRNKLAHELEPPDLSVDMLKLAEDVRRQFGDKFPKEELDWKIGTCVALLVGRLASFQTTTTVLRDFVAGYNAGRLSVINAEKQSDDAAPAAPSSRSC